VKIAHVNHARTPPVADGGRICLAVSPAGGRGLGHPDPVIEAAAVSTRTEPPPVGRGNAGLRGWRGDNNPKSWESWPRRRTGRGGLSPNHGATNCGEAQDGEPCRVDPRNDHTPVRLRLPALPGNVPDTPAEDSVREDPRRMPASLWSARSHAARSSCCSPGGVCGAGVRDARPAPTQSGGRNQYHAGRSRVDAYAPH
jgi:hypothetical protein